MNVCPVCRNVNSNDATVCRYCRSTLTPPAVAAVISRSRPRWPWFAGGAAALVLLVGIGSFALSGGNTAAAVEPAAEGVAITVGTGEGPSLEFEPTSVSAPPNTPVALTFTNQSTLPHNLTFQNEITAKTADIGEGVSETLNFTTPGPGSYQFVCTIHPGMDGELAVQ